MTTPLAWFGLPHDADERELKRAYAKRLKEARPDVDPEGFQVLREKYEAAMAWCRHRPAAAMPGAQLDHGEDAQPSPAADVPLDKTASELPPTPEHSEPASSWRVQSVSESAKAEAPFDVDAFVWAYLQVCAHEDAAQLQRWLQDQPALWSLRHTSSTSRPPPR